MATHKAIPLMGSINLNFDVRAGLNQPSNPKENTIWVKTETPVRHWSLSGYEPDRKSNNKNLIVFPYYDENNTTDNGITFTVAEDGTVIANGEATADATFSLTPPEGILASKGNYYTISGVTADSEMPCRIEVMIMHNNAAQSKYLKQGEIAESFKVYQDSQIHVYIKVTAGTIANNLEFKPMLEKGYTATEYIAGYATGQLWLQTLNFNGLVSFNALKENQISTNLTAAYQWNGAEWSTCDSYIYVNGEWMMFDAAPIANAIETFSWSGKSSGNGGNLGVLEDNKLEVSITRTGSVSDVSTSTCITENKIDVTGFSKIIFHFPISIPTSPDVYVGISEFSDADSTGEYSFAASVIAKAPILGGESTHTVDVSEIKGKYYIVVHMVGAAATGTVDAIVDTIILE